MRLFVKKLLQNTRILPRSGSIRLTIKNGAIHHFYFLMTRLTRIFHTGLSRGAANPDLDTTGGRETAVETAFRQP